MTEEILQKANNLKKDIEFLEEKRNQIFDFDKLLKERKPSDQEQQLFLNSMIRIVDAFMEVKKEKFKSL